MWHASAVAPTVGQAETMARRELEGVGDARAGEWVEYTPRAVHVRRRLVEQEAARVNDVRDIRGTPEERTRLRRLLRDAPHLARVLDADGRIH